MDHEDTPDIQAGELYVVDTTDTQWPAEIKSVVEKNVPKKIYLNPREAELLRMTEDISDEIFDRYFELYETETKLQPEAFDRALMIARLAVQFPNMPEADLIKAIDLYLESGDEAIFEVLLAQAEEDEKAELFDMWRDFERIKAMKNPSPPKLNRAQRRAMEKVNRKKAKR